MSRQHHAWRAALPALALTIPLAAGCGARETDRAAVAPVAAVAPSQQVTPELELLLARLEQLRQRHREDEGLELARRYLAEHPGAPRLHFAIGVLLGSKEDHRGAIREFERELAANPEHFGSHRGLGLAATLIGKPELAVEHFAIGAVMRPDDADMAFELGRNLSTLRRFAEAEPLLTRAAHDRNDADAWAELGLLYRRSNRPDEAIAAFRRALGSDPHHVPSLFNLGQLMVRAGRRELGQALLARHRDRARLADRLGYLERSSRLPGATAANFAALAGVELRSGGREAARAAYLRSLALDGDFAPAALGLATLLLEDGELEQASRWAVVALLAAPGDHRTHLALGMVRLANRQFPEADRAFTESRQRLDWEAETWLQVALASERAGASEQADAAFGQAARLAPGSPDVALARGRLFLRRGSSDQAADFLRASLSRQPASAEGWMLLGIAARSMGERDEATVAWRRAIALQRADLFVPGGAQRLAEGFADLPGAKDALGEYLRLAARDAEPQDARRP